MKNVLITGGAGFIGSNLACKLINLGFNVTILDNLSPQIHGGNPEKSSFTFKSAINAGVRFIEGTVTDKDDWIKALDAQDAVIHLAAETGTGQSMYEIQKYVDVNIGGTAILLDLLANTPHTIKKIIVASSRAIYGEGKYNCINHGYVYPEARADADMKNKHFECKCPHCGSELELMPTDEASKIHPTSLYGLTKQAQEEMVLMIGKSLGIPAVAFRQRRQRLHPHLPRRADLLQQQRQPAADQPARRLHHRHVAPEWTDPARADDCQFLRPVLQADQREHGGLRRGQPVPVPHES